MAILTSRSAAEPKARHHVVRAGFVAPGREADAGGPANLCFVLHARLELAVDRLSRVGRLWETTRQPFRVDEVNGDLRAPRSVDPASRDRAASGQARPKPTRCQSFAVTRERIRQIEAKPLRKLRHPIGVSSSVTARGPGPEWLG
jgi:hypothetical protein